MMVAMSEDPPPSTDALQTEPLQTISTFARGVGLSPSALRLYADNGLVVPAEVDGRTGYRYYTPEQQRRAVLVRRLRDAGVPLAEIKQVLDSDDGADVLRRHAQENEARAVRSRQVLDDVLSALRRPDDPPAATTRATVGGAELAGALEQVVVAAAAAGDRSGLDGILVEVGTPEVSVVATDRYWMAWRSLTPSSQTGPHRRILVPASSVDEVVAWARRHVIVDLVAGKGEARLAAGEDELEVASGDDRFPSFRQVFDGVPAPVVQLVISRDDLVARAAAVRSIDPSSPVRILITPGKGHARITGGTGSPLSCVVADSSLVAEAGERCTPLAIALAGGLLERAAAATIGTHVIMRLADASHPVVLCSADQTGFIALVMPQRS